MSLTRKSRALLISELASRTKLRVKDITDKSTVYDPPRSKRGTKPAALALEQSVASVSRVFVAVSKRLFRGFAKIAAADKRVEATANELWVGNLAELHARLLALLQTRFRMIALATAAEAANRNPATTKPSTKLKPVGSSARAKFIMELRARVAAQMPTGPGLSAADLTALSAVATYGAAAAIVAPKYEAFAGRDS